MKYVIITEKELKRLCELANIKLLMGYTVLTEEEIECLMMILMEKGEKYLREKLKKVLE